MFLDGREVKSGAEIRSEICIIGAGAAGITMASELSQSGIDVCLLESGGLEFDWATQDLYRGENVGLPYFDLDVCQIRYFGGNTNAWGGWCRPLDEHDLRNRAWIADSGWPFPLSALSAHYRRAHRFCELSDTEYSPEWWVRKLDHPRAKLLPFDPTRIETAIYQFSPPTRFGTVYRETIGKSRNVKCFLHTNALKIKTTPAAEAATHVEVAARPGTQFSISANLFVLAAGGTENPRLLLLSNDATPSGLGNGNDLVGRYFMEHPHTQRRIIPLNRRASVALYGLAFHGRGMAARFAVPWEVQQREELLNYTGNIHAAYRAHNSKGWSALRRLVLCLSGSRQTDPFLRFPPYGKKEIRLADLYQIARHLEKATLAAFLQLLQPERFIVGYILESKSEQAPNRDSRITLQHDCDAFGQNRVRLDWRMLAIDRRTVWRAEEIVEEELRRLAIGTLAPLSTEQLSSWPANLEGGWHQLGTTRMHSDPRYGVVDANCKVHGVGNVYIASGSVFPTSGAAPPTLTIVALALRLADHLKRMVGRSEQPIALFEPANVSEPQVATHS